jgi:hypothetical protein
MRNATLDAIKARKLAAALRVSGRIVSEGNARVAAIEAARAARLAAAGDRRPR